MASLLGAVLAVHVAAGFIGLIAFWVPVVAVKGGRNHVKFGRIYEISAYIVAVSSILAPSIRMARDYLAGRSFSSHPELYAMPIFLAYVGLVTLAIVRHGVRVNRVRNRPMELRTPLHILLSWAPYAGAAAIATLALAVPTPDSPVLLALIPIAVVYGWAMRRDVRDPAGSLPRRGWFFSHMTAMLLGGVAFHSAFLAQQTLHLGLPGWLAIVPWVLPSAIGFPAIVLWNRHYHRRFGGSAVTASAPAPATVDAGGVHGA